MPMLHWIGKARFIQHHQQVPFQTFTKKYTYTAPPPATYADTPLFEPSVRLLNPGDSDNKIIHCNNLEALNVLLSKYECIIECIHIDPAYNTRNKNWVYNDNVNNPKIKEWLGKVVGKESEDFTRHDKWLCVIYPRLKLLHRLFSDDGAIFISIYDNEQDDFRLIYNGMFGEICFTENILWGEKTEFNARRNISVAHELVVFYRFSVKKLNPYKRKLNKPLCSLKKITRNLDNESQRDWISFFMSNADYQKKHRKVDKLLHPIKSAKALASLNDHLYGLVLKNSEIGFSF